MMGIMIENQNPRPYSGGRPSVWGRFQQDVRLSATLLFGIYAVSISLLAFHPMGWTARLALILFGLLLPLGIDLTAGWTATDTLLPPTPSWTPGVRSWVLFTGALVFALTYRLSQIPVFLLGDEGMESFLGLDLIRHWRWDLILGEGQAEPLYPWLLSLVNRIHPLTFLELRLFQAGLYAAMVATGIWAAFLWFPRDRVFQAAILLAFSFAPFSLSRICNRSLLFLMLELALIGCLGMCLRVPRTRVLFFSVAFGLTAGLGFYSYTPWVVVATTACLGLLAAARTRPSLRGPALLGVGIVLFLFLPMAIARLNPGATNYIQGHFSIHAVGIPHLVGWFWDGQGSAPYGPVWGGFLNPIFGSLILVSVGGLGAYRRETWIRMLPVTMVLFYLPAFLTGDVQMHRTLFWFPLFLAGALEGLRRIAQSLSIRLRAWAPWLLIALSVTLDAYHYFGPYQDPAQYAEDKKAWRHPEWDRAYRWIQKRSTGPGRIAVLADGMPQYNDPTLYTSTRAWEGFPDEVPAGPSVTRVALVCNSNYLPFLQRRFPEGEWHLLSEIMPIYDYNALVGMIPMTTSNHSILERWIRAESAFRNVERAYQMDPYGRSDVSIEKTLQDCVPLVEGDPHLESILAEKLVLYHSIQKNLPAATQAIERALKFGDPAAHLWNEYGTLLYLSGKPQFARQAFQSAIGSELNRTYAQNNLLILDRMDTPDH